jgi:hypothetical protein
MNSDCLLEIGHCLLNSEKAGNPPPPRSVTVDLYREVKRLHKGLRAIQEEMESELAKSQGVWDDRAITYLAGREEELLDLIEEPAGQCRCDRCNCLPGAGITDMGKALEAGWFFTPPTSAPDAPDAYCPKYAAFLAWAFGPQPAEDRW